MIIPDHKGETQGNISEVLRDMFAPLKMGYAMLTLKGAANWRVGIERFTAVRKAL